MAQTRGYAPVVPIRKGFPLPGGTTLTLVGTRRRAGRAWRDGPGFSDLLMKRVAYTALALAVGIWVVLLASMIPRSAPVDVPRAEAPAMPPGLAEAFPPGPPPPFEVPRFGAWTEWAASMGVTPPSDAETEAALQRLRLAATGSAPG